MRQFRRGALSKQSHDLSMGREGKANVGHPVVTGHLQGTLTVRNEIQKK
jgi:hypothetical protein